MKKKVLQTGLALFLSLALLPSCKEDITNADENKKVNMKSLIKSKYTECSIYLGNFACYNITDAFQNPNYGYTFINIGDKSDYIKRFDTIYVDYDSIKCEHIVSKSDYMTWDKVESSLKMNFDFDKMIFKSIKCSYSKNEGRTASSMTNHSGFDHSDYFEFGMNNVPFDISKDSVISISISGAQINSLISKYRFEYSSSSDNNLNNNHTSNHYVIDQFVANDSTIYKIIIK